jgi:hypothetical protein
MDLFTKELFGLTIKDIIRMDVMYGGIQMPSMAMTMKLSTAFEPTLSRAFYLKRRQKQWTKRHRWYQSKRHSRLLLSISSRGRMGLLKRTSRG